MNIQEYLMSDTQFEVKIYSAFERADEWIYSG